MFAQETFNKVPPDIYFQEKDVGGWIVIDASARPATVPKDFFPYAVRIPCMDNPPDTSLEIKKLVGKYRIDPFLSILIVNEEGTHYDRIESTMNFTDLSQVFYLQGGLMAYGKFLRTLDLSWKGNPRIKTLRQCASCRRGR